MRTPLILALIACAGPALAEQPSLEYCAYMTLPKNNQNGLSQECSNLLESKAAELEQRGGLMAVAAAYKPNSQPNAGGWDVQKCDAENAKVLRGERAPMTESDPCYNILVNRKDLPAASTEAKPKASGPLARFKGQSQDQISAALQKEFPADQFPGLSGTLRYLPQNIYFCLASSYNKANCDRATADLKTVQDKADQKMDKECDAYKNVPLDSIGVPGVADKKKACIARSDAKMNLDPAQLKTPQQCLAAMQAQDKTAQAPGAADRSARLSDICSAAVGDMIAKKQKVPPDMLAYFEKDCHDNHHTAMCVAVRGAGPTAGNDAAAIAQTFFHNDPRMKDYFEKNPDKAKSFNDAYAKCQAQKGRASDDCMVELQRNWLSGNPGTPYAAIPDKFYKKAPGKRDLLQAIIDRQGWDDQMRQRFQGNLDKMSPQSFEHNYAGVLDGRPRTNAGRQYLVNACKGVPDSSPKEPLTTSELRGICTKYQRYEASRDETVPSPSVRSDRSVARRAPIGDGIMTPMKNLTRSISGTISQALAPLSRWGSQPRRPSSHWDRNHQDCWDWPTARRSGDPNCVLKQH